MNVQQYIASGVIEDYCLGLLSNNERAAVASNAAIYDEINAAIYEYEQVLKKFSEDLLLRGDGMDA